MSDHFNETVKQIHGIVRSRCVFRVVLHGEGGKRFMPHPFAAVVVEINVGQFNLLRVKSIHVHTEAVVLRGYFYTTGRQIFNRLIAAPMTKFQFVG